MKILGLVGWGVELPLHSAPLPSPLNETLVTCYPIEITVLIFTHSDETVAKVNQLLGQYVGTHNFHNFTSGTKFEQMASNRYIMSFEVSIS